MKVLHILEKSIPNLSGYSIRAKYIAEKQKELGMDPVVVTSPFFAGSDLSLKTEEVNGIRYYRTNYIKKPAPCKIKVLSYLQRFRMLRHYRNAVLEIAKIENPDIVHAHSSYTNGQAANYVSKKIGTPSIYELRSLWGESAVVEDGLVPTSLKYRLIWGLELREMRHSDRVIAISQGIKNEVVRKGIDPKKIGLVPNGVDSKRFSPCEKNKELLDKYQLRGWFVLGYIGSIRKLEGLSHLIEAFGMIRGKNGHVKLLVVGDGPERSALRKQVDLMGISDVIFTGNVPHEKITDYYSIVDLFVFPRIDAKINQTVTPLKPLEAMACGRVCLCSNVGGLRELVEDDFNGMVFRTEDPRDLSEKAIALIMDKERYNRLKSTALQWVRHERDWSILIPRYQAVYRELLGS